MEQDDFSQDTGVDNTENSQPTAESSESPEQDSSGREQEASSQPQEGNLPFNDPKSPEHARFKELREQAANYKSEFAKERQERENLQRQIQEMQSFIQQQRQQPQKQTAPAYNALVERLKGIDPEFAEWQSKALQAAETLPQLQNEIQSMRQERDRRQAYDTLNTLFTENKVPKEMQSLYERSIKAAVYEAEASGKRFTIKDIPNFFKNTHEEYSKFFEDRDRKQREGYVKAKKSDSTPASTTGVPAKSASSEKQLTQAELKAELVAALRRDKQTI